MTGAEVKRQVMEALGFPRVDSHGTHEASADALAPCIVLTAEEAAKIKRFIFNCECCMGGYRAELALLTKEAR